MCKKIFIFSFLFFALLGLNSYASEISNGIWKQTSSNAGDCSSCTIRVTNIYKDIIKVEGLNTNNGRTNTKWVGFYVYHKNIDEYKGFERWLKGDNDIGETSLILENNTLNKKSLYKNGTIKATYRKQ